MSPKDDIDGLAGMYNIMKEGEYETADYQIPLDEFIKKLRERDLPEQVCVVGLEEALRDEEVRQELKDVMRDSVDHLNSGRPLPLIQFVVDGEFHKRTDTFDVQVDDEMHSLRPLFGKGVKKRESNWLVTSFKV